MPSNSFNPANRPAQEFNRMITPQIVQTQVAARKGTKHLALAKHADAIRTLGKHMVADVVATGKHLSDAKQLCGHGNFKSWLNGEFGWTERTAQRFMQVYDLDAKSDKLSDFNLPLSGIYLLAAPSTPAHIREQVLDRAERGEVISYTEIKELLPRRAPSKATPTRSVAPAVHDLPTGDVVAEAISLVMRMTPHERREFASQLPGLIGIKDVPPTTGLTTKPVKIVASIAPPEMSQTKVVYSAERLERRKHELLADVDHNGIPMFLSRTTPPKVVS
jgi:hypothetical protein